LQTNDGREIYFNANSVLNGNFAKLKVGTRVTFTEEVGEKGAQASTVRLLERHGMRL
jgi:cold shock CspA family protein